MDVPTRSPARVTIGKQRPLRWSSKEAVHAGRRTRSVRLCLGGRQRTAPSASVRVAMEEVFDVL
jgi:hypothetical protein